MKKIAFSALSLAVLIAFGCSYASSENSTHLAAQHCLEQGGDIVINNNTQGLETEYCVLPNGTCEQWAYYSGACDPAAKVAPLAIPDQAKIQLAAVDTASLQPQDIVPSGNFHYKNGQYKGDVFVKGFAQLCENCDDPKTMLFYVLDHNNSAFENFLRTQKQYNNIPDGSLLLGCFTDDQTIRYTNAYDVKNSQAGSRLFYVDPQKTQQLLQSSPQTPIVLTLKRKKLTNEVYRPDCYSEFVGFKIVQ